jgi:hypothetical protein
VTPTGRRASTLPAATQTEQTGHREQQPAASKPLDRGVLHAQPDSWSLSATFGPNVPSSSLIAETRVKAPENTPGAA